MLGIKILQTAHYVPPKILTNDEISQWVDTSDEWISKRTGIRQRHISQGENTSDLCTKVANELLEKSGISAKDLDLIIICTVTPDYLSPSVASIVGGNIKATCIAFDINAACTGFVYGFNVAARMLQSGQYKRAMVIGAETLSKVLDWTDRNTCILFGDGAGGVIIESAPEGSSMYMEKLHTRGSMAISVRYIGVNNPFFKDEKQDNFVHVDGREVFEFAVKSVSENIRELLEEANLTIDDIAVLIPHQANRRIIEGIAKKLKTDLSKFYINIENYGNTSSGSIPIALNELFRKGEIKPGDKIIMSGFGGGLTWGSILVEI